MSKFRHLMQEFQVRIMLAADAEAANDRPKSVWMLGALGSCNVVADFERSDAAVTPVLDHP